MPGPMTRPNGLGKKEKLDKESLLKLVRYLKPYHIAIIFALIFAIISAIVQIISPSLIEDLIEIIQKGITSVSGIDMSEFLSMCVMIIVVYIIGALFGYLQQFIMAIVNQNTSKKLRSEIDHKLSKLPLSYFDKTTRGDILSKVTNDVDTISQTLGSSVANLVSACVLFIGVIIMMFSVNVTLACITILSSVLGFLLMFLVIGKSQKYFNKRQENLGEMNRRNEWAH